MKKLNVSLIEYYRQFIKIVVVLYKPSHRGNLDVQDAALIQNVKLLYDSHITIKSISRFFTRQQFKNLERLDHQALIRYFLNSNMALKPLVNADDYADFIEDTRDHGLRPYVDGRGRSFRYRHRIGQRP